MVGVVISIIEFAEAACFVLCVLALIFELIFAMIFDLFGQLNDRMSRIANRVLMVIPCSFIVGCILEGVSNVLSKCFS